MRSFVVMVGMSVALVASAAWAASRPMSDAGLPQPQLADEPEAILAMPCGGFKLLRLEVAEYELGLTIQRLLDRRQTDQVQRVLDHRLRQRAAVVAALPQAARCRGL